MDVMFGMEEKFLLEYIEVVFFIFWGFMIKLKMDKRIRFKICIYNGSAFGYVIVIEKKFNFFKIIKEVLRIGDYEY